MYFNETFLNTSEDSISTALECSDDVDGLGSIDLRLLLETLLGTGVGTSDTHGGCGPVIRRAPLIFFLPFSLEEVQEY